MRTILTSGIPLILQRTGLFFPLSIFVVALLCISTSLMGQEQEGSEDIKKDISKFRGTIRQLQHGIIQQEGKITETRNTAHNILGELEILDAKLDDQQKKLVELERKTQQQQEMIKKEEQELNKFRTEKNVAEGHLQKRMTAYYTMGDIGLLNVTFSTKTLPELLTFHDAFDVLIKYDQDVIKAYRETIDELVRLTAALDLEKLVLEDFIEQNLREKELLQKTMIEKKTLLTHVRTQEKLHKQAIVEMQQAADNLAESIVSAKSKSLIYEQKFLSHKGKLPPPVHGVISTFFGQEKINKLGISRKSKGIELQAANGVKIISVGDGEVIYTGYLRGYGNTVIVHHGFQYYTVTSRIEKILINKGAVVRRGETIGVMGETATLFDEGLYFELRHGRESLDPLAWLTPDSLSKLYEQ
jgi:septal ring factor EnvC (AmiA/AmiB activator)